MKAEFMALSFVGSNALAEDLGPAGTGVYVTQVVPPPTDTTYPITANYNRALRPMPQTQLPDLSRSKVIWPVAWPSRPLSAAAECGSGQLPQQSAPLRPLDLDGV